MFPVESSMLVLTAQARARVLSAHAKRARKTNAAKRAPGTVCACVYRSLPQGLLVGYMHEP